jgi:hypothetical protein
VSAGHPPAPWRLHGRAIVVPALVPVERARIEVPAGVEIVPVAPGLTAGGLIAVTYEEGSTLTYSELIASPALVRSGRHVGGWISHIWVDSEHSVSGGRSIWKLPKELASFSHDRRDDGTQRFEATDANGVPLVRLAAGAPRLTAPAALPAAVPMISVEAGAHFFTLGRSSMRTGLARVRVEITADSPFASAGLRPSPVAVVGYASLVMPAARPI